MNTTDRIDWIDKAKGVGIFLVVTAHVFLNASAPILQKLAKFIYLFHMPLFFMLSGMLYKPEVFSVLFKKRVVSLLIPYTAFLFLLTIKSLIGTAAHSYGEALKYMSQIIYGGYNLKGWVGVFWFISCLFLTQLAYNALINCAGGKTYNPLARPVVFVILLCSSLTLLTTQVRLPLAAEVVPIAMVFFWNGHLIRAQNLLNSNKMLVLSVLCASICVFLYVDGYTALIAFDMKPSLFGLPVVSIVFAVSLVVVVLKAIIFISNVKYIGEIMASIGSASLVIMYLSQPINLTLRDRHWPDFFIVLLSIILPYLFYSFIKLNWISRLLLLGISNKKTPVIR
ncbi:MAG: acyltransferase family protein [Methylobacter sp.]|nr:acyltransferase family protein [Methylobacter sp.]